MPNYYVAAEGVAARTIASTRPVVDPETGLESLPFVAPFTDEARLAGGSATDVDGLGHRAQGLRRQRRRRGRRPAGSARRRPAHAAEDPGWILAAANWTCRAA
jgi:hypothetical protein